MVVEAGLALVDWLLIRHPFSDRRDRLSGGPVRPAWALINFIRRSIHIYTPLRLAVCYYSSYEFSVHFAEVYWKCIHKQYSYKNACKLCIHALHDHCYMLYTAKKKLTWKTVLFQITPNYI